MDRNQRLMRGTFARASGLRVAAQQPIGRRNPHRRCTHTPSATHSTS